MEEDDLSIFFKISKLTKIQKIFVFLIIRPICVFIILSKHIFDSKNSIFGKLTILNVFSDSYDV